MLKNYIIALIVLELFMQPVEPEVPDMPHNGEGKCLTFSRTIIDCN